MLYKRQALTNMQKSWCRGYTHYYQLTEPRFQMSKRGMVRRGICNQPRFLTYNSLHKQHLSLLVTLVTVMTPSFQHFGIMNMSRGSCTCCTPHKGTTDPSCNLFVQQLAMYMPIVYLRHA